MSEFDDTPKGAQTRPPPAIVSFPQSRVRPPGGIAPYKEIGIGHLARTLGITNEQLSGHWCSRCKGIWFGYLLEVECPACGNRSG